MVVTLSGPVGLTAVRHVIEASKREKERVPIPLLREMGQGTALILELPQRAMSAMTLFAHQVGKSFSSFSRFCQHKARVRERERVCVCERERGVGWVGGEGDWLRDREGGGG